MGITIDANKLVYELYPNLRKRLSDTAPFLDETFGNHLADQGLRHAVHRITNSRSNSSFTGSLPETDAFCLAQQMMSVGQLTNRGWINGVVMDMLVTAQRLACDQVRSYEISNGVEITGQTP